MYKQCLSVVAGLLAVAAFALSPGTASAQHHGGHGGGGWHGGGGGGHGGGWGGYRGGYYGGRGRDRGWGGVGIGIGLGYPWYGGYGGYGYYPGYYGGYGYSPYYYGGSDVYYDTTPYYSGAMPYDTPDYSYGSRALVQDNAAHVRVVVPSGAKVWFDDRMTQQTGSVREFETPALTPGRDFSYDIKARWRDRDGKDVTLTRHVDVRANANVTVDFTRPAQ
jgi:uncharacterized protein (TIGR03000 family)